MKQFKLSEKMFKNALYKCKEFRAFTDDINEKANAFDHCIKALRIEYTAYFEVVFKYHHINWPDEENVYTCKFTMQPKDTITGYVKDYQKVLINLFTNHFKDSFDTGELEWYHKVDAINISIEEYSLTLNSLTAWSCDHVGIYWVEQECGEHWITLPKEPKKEIATYLRID